MQQDIKERLDRIDKRLVYQEELLLSIATFLRESYTTLDDRTCRTLAMTMELIKRSNNPKTEGTAPRVRVDFEQFMALPYKTRVYIYCYLKQPAPRVPGDGYAKFGVRAFDYPEFIQLLSELPDRCIM